MGPSIHIRSVSHNYENASGTPLRVLNDIQFDICGGSLTAILGPSGCGKTTLLNIVAGFLMASNGEIGWGDSQTNGVRPTGAALSYVFQDASLLPWRTAYQNVGLPLELSGTPAEERNQRILSALDRVKLEGFAAAFPDELSGGMRSRVALAQSLVSSPEVLLLDEPFGALDEPTAIDVSERLSLLLHYQESTVIMVTHSILQALLLADTIVILSKRPAVVATVIPIPIPKPRSAAIFESGVGASLFQKIRRELMGVDELQVIQNQG